MHSLMDIAMPYGVSSNQSLDETDARRLGGHRSYFRPSEVWDDDRPTYNSLHPEVMPDPWAMPDSGGQQVELGGQNLTSRPLEGLENRIRISLEGQSEVVWKESNPLFISHFPEHRTQGFFGVYFNLEAQAPPSQPQPPNRMQILVSELDNASRRYEFTPFIEFVEPPLPSPRVDEKLFDRHLSMCRRTLHV